MDDMLYSKRLNLLKFSGCRDEIFTWITISFNFIAFFLKTFFITGMKPWSAASTLHLKSLHSKMCFACCNFSWMFELRCVEWCMCWVRCWEAVFTFIWWRRKVSLLLTLNLNLTFCLGASHGPVCNLHECDVETSNLQSTQTDNELFSQVADCVFNS